MIRTRYSHNLHSLSSSRLFAGLVCLLLFGAQTAFGQEACPPPPNYVENPLSTPSITAAEVAANPTADNLREFAAAGRDYLLSVTTQLETAHLSCLMRQEGGDWRSGGIFPVAMSFNPELAVNRQAPINMRILFHASHMAHAGRLVKPEMAGAILLAASSDVAGGAPVPGLGGHAVLYGLFVLVVGLDLQEPHLDPHFIDSHYIPQVTAREVVDRASLKVFVNEAIHYLGQLVETHGFDSAHVARAALRDPNGPWISGPIYLFMFDPVHGYTVFHGAFPDRYEYRVTGTARDAVTGELLLPKILAAAEQEGGGFVEYHFDNPDDDSDDVYPSKVTYARKHTYTYPHPTLGETSNAFVLAAGFYPGAGSGSGVKMTRSCAERGIAAGAVQTLEDIQPFVECAAEYLAEHGAEEARRAFNEDERWKHGPTYVGVQSIAPSGEEVFTYVFPPDPSREGQLWGEAIDDYGTDLFYETYRMMSLVDSGWLYYSFPNPATGREAPKASYVIEVDWDGSRAAIGAGLYARDLPGTCYPDEVSAAVLEAAPSDQTLREFVRCAAMMVESEGYFAKEEIERNARWAGGENYVFVLDTMGNQLITGSGARLDGRAPHEWGSAGAREDQFGGRDLAAAAAAFGEAHVYYRSRHPESGAQQPKVGFLKRVDAQGVELLVGAGYYYDPDQAVSVTNPSEPSRSGRVVVEGDDAELGDADFVLNSAAISADALQISASYGGGCRTHEFTLVIAASFIESSPVRLPAVVRHDADGDPCEAWLTESYAFDLALVRERYREFYGPGAGRVVLELDGVDEDRLVYEFTDDPSGGIPEPPGPGSRCADNFVTAAGIRTRSDIKAFVVCAAEYAMEHGTEEARRAFNEDERWKQGPTYVFVDAIEPSGEEAFTYVYPPDPAREGMPWGESIDGFGSDYFFEAHRILSLVDEGWIYYTVNNPATGREQLKSSYLIEIDWNGERAALGAGIYAPDLPGACEPDEINAAALRGNSDDRKLREFVNCAAMKVASSGYFAGSALSSDPRWKQGPIYVFGINAETGATVFSGSESSFAGSGRFPELLFDGRDAIEAASLFGEGFWYYNFHNPATQQMEPKVSFVKLVRAEGVPLLVGSGHRPVLRRYRPQRTGN